jgi:hypothetical protein
LITILVRARRELGDVMQRAVREVDKLTQAETKRADVERKTAATTAVTRKSVDDLNKSYTDYLKRLEKGDADVKSATKQLGFFSAEFDRLARKAGAGTKAADDLLKLSRNAKTAAEEITKAGKVQQAQIEASYRQAAEMEAGFKRLADDRADREAQANEREKRRLKDREFFWKEVLGAIVEDERRSAADRIEISRAEHEDFERQSRSRIETQQLEAKKIADIEASIAKHSSRIEGERVKIINARQAAEEKAAAAQRRADDAEAERTRKRADAARDLSNEIHRATMQYDDLAERIRTRDVGGDDARLLARQLSQRFRALERPAVTTFGVGSPEAGAAGGGVLRSQQLVKDLEPQGIRRVAVEAERATQRVSGLTGALHRLFRVDPGRTEAINDAIEGIENKLAAASYNAVHFAGTLRALVYVGVVVFFNELVSGAIALAGALTTVASTAIEAGAALGGSLAAGAAQALPVIGLLAAAWGRVGAVFKAVQQNIKQHTQASKESSDAAERQREAAKGVADAQQRLKLAQQGLNVAIKEGRREWEDIMSAERSAQLQSERSTLSQRQSRAAFNQALRSGDISATADLSLRVREADFDAEGAATRLARAQEDASTARRTGPSGLPSVVAARRSVQEAREALKEARIEARNAVEQISAADTRLQQMLADLSPAERQLYEVLNRVVARYREVFTGPGGVLEPIIEAFTFGAQRVLDLLDDSRLIDAARRLSDQIAVELRRGFSFLSDESSRDFIITMAEQARRNLPTITTLATQLVRIGEALARAGGPALSRFLDFFTVLATRAAAAAGSGSGIDRLTAFFLKGEEYAEDIVNLTGAIGGLFAAIVGSAAGQGQGVILSITDSIKDATRWINDHQREVHEFFSDALRASASIAHALVVLARGLFSLFDADQVVAFSNAFTRTFVPAVIAVLGSSAR